MVPLRALTMNKIFMFFIYDFSAKVTSAHFLIIRNNGKNIKHFLCQKDNVLYQKKVYLRKTGMHEGSLEIRRTVPLRLWNIYVLGIFTLYIKKSHDNLNPGPWEYLCRYLVFLQHCIFMTFLQSYSSIHSKLHTIF